jgi:hypothetical protein
VPRFAKKQLIALKQSTNVKENFGDNEYLVLAKMQISFPTILPGESFPKVQCRKIFLEKLDIIRRYLSASNLKVAAKIDHINSANKQKNYYLLDYNSTDLGLDC